MQRKEFFWIAGSILILMVVIFLVESFFSSPISIDLSTSSTGIIEDNVELYKLTIELNSEKDLHDLNGKIILPEGLELVDGNLSWNFDLQKSGSIQTEILVKPVSEGEWNIGVIVENENEKSLVLKELILNVDPSLKIYISEDEWIAREKERLKDPYWVERYYRVCDVDCFVPEPLKGDDLNSYFKSLNLTEETIYVMLQFDVLGADPSENQMGKLEKNGVILLDNAARHTWFARAPKEFLETKSYDFIRWIGIPSDMGKVDPILREKIFNSSCAGTAMVNIIFYEKLSEKQAEKISKVLNTNVPSGSEQLKMEFYIEYLNDVSSFDFVKSVSPVVSYGVCPPSNPFCGDDPLNKVVCKT